MIKGKRIKNTCFNDLIATPLIKFEKEMYLP